MKLIGLLDSPFVRRTAISLSIMGFKFNHRSLSVFGDYEAFQKINPLVKAPTLVLNNGEFLIDSNLILQYAEAIGKHSLFSDQASVLAKQMHILGVASIASEKTVQVVYEFDLRSEEKRHAPWLNRVTEQLNHAYQQLENALATQPELFKTDSLSHASITTAVSWFFTHNMKPGLINPDQYPLLKSWSEQCEALDVFKQYPYDFGMSPE